MQLSLKLYPVLFVLLLVSLQIHAEYDVPEVEIKALKPKGLRVAIPGNI